MFFLIFAISFSVSAQKNYFTNISESVAQSAVGQRFIVPSKLRATKIDVIGLKSFLWSLPAEVSVINSANAPVMIIPMPDGRDAKFHVWESSIMEEGLASRYPEIKTFAGQGIDDPYATLKMSYDPYFGFYAQVLTPGGVYYIDPYLNGNVNFYQSYFRADYRKDDHFVCFNREETPVENAVANTTAGPCRGTSLFAYRIAIACTGEYARAATGTSTPTVPQTLAKIVISANRINGVYETELAIRLILVSTEDQLIYLDPTTDPFTNNNPGTLINESQNVIRATIGAATYDIGHTFSTGGGGLAGFGVVCNDDQKGRGITGISRPYGDAYDIDYVSHEIGHQFGASHTFNSSAGSCGGGNRASNSAYEPGSGTTIMGYASICDNDDLQNHSDPMFHSRSFDQISSFVSSGGSCRVATPTGNQIPVITSMSGNNSIIPPQTPFTLTGTATDPDGDPLTYSWEEWDLGPTTTWNGGANNTSSPLFKVRLPKTTGSRTFPDIAVINANFPVNPSATMGGLKGETMTNVERKMRFRFVVRDNKAGGGGVATGGDGCQVSEIFQIETKGSSPFLVIVPNGFESYPGGSAQTIKWNTAGTEAAPIGVANVKISLSTDGGLTYPTVIIESTPNDGSELLTIPAVGVTSTARIKIEAIGNIFFDVSNNNFSITGAVAPTFDFNFPSPATITCGGSSNATITLASVVTNGFSTPIQLTATGAPAGTSVSFSSNPLTPGNSTVVTLNGANTLANGTYTITVTGVANGITKTRDLSFVVSGGNAPVITSQPSSQSGCSGSATTFTVSATGANNYQWQVSANGGVSFSNITGANSASYVIANTTGSLNGNIYHVIVSNQCASVTSANANLSIVTTPSISTQPTNANACSGQNATFNVVINGTATYQWQVNTGSSFVNIPGANTATLTLASVTSGMNGNTYRVVITNSCGTVTSTVASLVVNTTASITTQPASLTLCSGQSAAFTVVGAGTGISYQWQLSSNGGTSFSDITGANSATYSIASTTGSQNGNIYRVIVSSQCNSVTSNNANLTVTTTPAITTQPVNANACTGQTATFTVVNTGTATYQWQVNTGSGFSNITGATSASLSLPAVTAGMNGNTYQVIISNACATITSSVASLVVNTTASITTQPTSVAVCSGLPATFTVAGAGTGIQYQWQVSTNGGTTFSDITGANTATFNIANTTTSQNGNIYRVTVSSQCNSVTSSNVNLTVTTTPAITTQPVNANACTGQTATFSVVNTGTATYQWQVNTGSGFVNVGGATSSTLTLPSVTAGMNGNTYQVIISNACATITSTSASLVVNTTASITSQPTAVTLCSGLPATFTVAGAGTGIQYQWQVSTDGGTTFANIAGATSPGFNITATTASQNGNIYHAVVSSQCNSVTSTNATLTVNSAPAITTAPVNTDACNGLDATITSVISGSPTYQWEVSTDGGATFSPVAGANAASLQLTNVASSMSGNRYRVTATNGCGTVTSTPVTLTVNTVVTVNTQPTDVNICAGLNTSFSISATGTGLGYQWQVSTDDGVTFTDISGATNATYNINNVPTSLNNNKYRVVITSACSPAGTVSDVVLLTVFSPVTINAAPVNTSVCIDNDATFTVDASGSGLTYQWQISTDNGATFTDISGATTSSYTFEDATPAIDGTMVRVIVSGVPCGIITTDAVTLTVNPVPAVTVNSNSITALFPGLTTTLSGTVVPSPAASYQWYLNGSAIPGATSETYTVNSQHLGTYTFTATAANGCVGSSTNSITIRDSANGKLFIFPNPNRGQFNVAYYGETTPYTGAATLTIFDAKGSRVFVNTYVINAPYQAMPVDLKKQGKGIYFVELSDKNGKRIKTGTVSVL